MSEDKQSSNPIPVGEVVIDVYSKIENAYNNNDFRTLLKDFDRLDSYRKILNDYEESLEEQKEREDNSYREELKQSLEDEFIKDLKESLYQDYEIKLKQKNKRENLFKTYEKEFYQNEDEDKIAPVYKFMEKSTQEDLANGFIKVYHYLASTYYKADSCYPLKVKNILDMMIASQR